MLKTILDLNTWCKKICDEIEGSSNLVGLEFVDQKIVCGKFNVEFSRQRAKKITEIITLEGDFLKSNYRYWFVYEKSEGILYLFLYKFPQLNV